MSPFSRRMEKCAQPMLQLSVLVCELALGNPDITSEGLVAGMRDDGEQFFRCFLAAIFGLHRQGLKPMVYQFISTDCGHTHPVSELASKTTTNEPTEPNRTDRTDRTQRTSKRNQRTNEQTSKRANERRQQEQQQQQQQQQQQKQQKQQAAASSSKQQQQQQAFGP